MKFYTCVPVNPNSKFTKSAWAGEAYDTKADANAHKKFFEKEFGEKFTVEKEEC